MGGLDRKEGFAAAAEQAPPEFEGAVCAWDGCAVVGLQDFLGDLAVLELDECVADAGARVAVLRNFYAQDELAKAHTVKDACEVGLIDPGFNIAHPQGAGVGG